MVLVSRMFKEDGLFMRLYPYQEWHVYRPLEPVKSP